MRQAVRPQEAPAPCPGCATRLAALEARIEAVERAQSAARGPQADERAMLAIVAAVPQGQAFNAVELLEHGRIVDPHLQDALTAAGASTAKTLGALLGRLRQRRSVRGFILLRVTRDEHGTVWEVRAVSDPGLHGPSTAAARESA